MQRTDSTQALSTLNIQNTQQHIPGDNYTICGRIREGIENIWKTFIEYAIWFVQFITCNKCCAEELRINYSNPNEIKITPRAEVTPKKEINPKKEKKRKKEKHRKKDTPPSGQMTFQQNNEKQGYTFPKLVRQKSILKSKSNREDQFTNNTGNLLKKSVSFHRKNSIVLITPRESKKRHHKSGQNQPTTSSYCDIDQLSS